MLVTILKIYSNFLALFRSDFKIFSRKEQNFKANFIFQIQIVANPKLSQNSGELSTLSSDFNMDWFKPACGRDAF